jgi:putative restriction endonuclease
MGADGTPTKRELLRVNASGHFKEEILKEFKRKPTIVQELARLMLEAHFPTSLHEDICSAVGIDLTEQRPAGGGRDPNFRHRVLLSYGYRCAICGLQILLSGTQIALEAAHIKWHQAGGPAEVRNGLCLCVLHHKLLDLGALSIGAGLEILVSDEASGGFGFDDCLMKHHGKPLHAPTHPGDVPSSDFIGWHRRQVFRGRSRPV